MAPHVAQDETEENAAFDEKAALEQAYSAEFSRRLTATLARRGMSQSDLARAIWGSKQDSRGRVVARNRDSISSYVLGKKMPEQKTIQRMAKVLKVKPEDLHPPLGSPTGPNQPTPYSFTVLGGRPDMALLRVNTLVPTTIAVRVCGLIARVDPIDGKRALEQLTKGEEP